MTVELRDYIERIIEEHERQNIGRIRSLEMQVESLEALVNAKQESLALAVEKQESAYNARFEGVNEWRAAFGDVVNRAVQQDVYATKSREVDRRLNEIENRLANFDGRIIGTSAGFGIASMIITLVISIVLFGGQ